MRASGLNQVRAASAQGMDPTDMETSLGVQVGPWEEGNSRLPPVFKPEM